MILKTGVQREAGTPVLEERGRMDMRKTSLKILVMVLFWVAIALIVPEKGGRVQAESKPEYRQDVPLDESHFPDERFRKQLTRCVDMNRDGVLSVREREKIHFVEFGRSCSLAKGWYADMQYTGGEWLKHDDKYALELCYDFQEEEGDVDVPEKVLDVTGIEYFFNIEEVRADKYEMISGSFQSNADLKKIWVSCTDPAFSKYGQRNYDNIRASFPISQMMYIHLNNILTDRLNMQEVPELRVLRVILPDGSNRRLSSVDLSKNHRLKELELGHALPGKLDLRKNQKLRRLKLYSGQGKAGQRYGETHYETDFYEDDEDEYYMSHSHYEYYLPEKGQKCKVIFPKRNQIQTLYYFTRDKMIDISMLTQLNNFQTLKKTKAKVKSSWIRKTFTKKKWGCAVVKNGKFVKKIKAEKRKKFTMI